MALNGRGQDMSTDRRPYPSDLSDAEWKILKPLLPAERPGGRHRLYDLREIINAIQYLREMRLCMGDAAS
jgi:predicted secreted protein